MPTACEVLLSPQTGRIAMVVRRGMVMDAEIIYQDENNAPIDITGWVVEIKSREETPVIDWSTSNGRIDISAGNGSIKLSVSNADTLALPSDTSGEIYLAMTDTQGATRPKLEGPYQIRQP